MSISMRQAEKVLRKAGVKYSMESIIKPFKFNSLTSDGDSLYFSFKGQEPLTVKIK